MNKFRVFREYSLYELEDKVKDFLEANGDNIQVISHSMVIREFKNSDDIYICTIIYKVLYLYYYL